jgi:trigger factor
VFNEVARAAAVNDRVTVDFVGKIDGVEFEGGSGQAVPIVIGANQVMKEFEEAPVRSRRYVQRVTPAL